VDDVTKVLTPWKIKEELAQVQKENAMAIANS
jgi:hypothetical protein